MYDALILIFTAICAIFAIVGAWPVIKSWFPAQTASAQPAAPSNKRWALLLVVACFSLFFSCYGLYRIHALRTEPFKFEYQGFERLNHVKDKHFFREEVVLDGTFFENCIFNDVTLTYNGIGGVAFKNSSFGNIRYKSTSDSIGTAMGLLAAFGFFKPGVPIEGPDGQLMKPMPGAEHVGEPQTH